MIIRKLQQRDGIHIDTPLQALQKLAEQGYQDVAIQSLHIINGDEYEKIVREVQSMRPRFQRLTLGAPLLSGHGDYVQLMQALRQQMPPLAATERVVFIGTAPATTPSRALRLSGSYDGGAGFSGAVGAVESYPEVDIVINELSRQGVTGVHLMPLMLVAGDHAINDMASDEDDSWKTRFNAAGIPATPWLNGLGENPAVRAMFVARSAAGAERHDGESSMSGKLYALSSGPGGAIDHRACGADPRPAGCAVCASRPQRRRQPGATPSYANTWAHTRRSAAAIFR